MALVADGGQCGERASTLDVGRVGRFSVNLLDLHPSVAKHFTCIACILGKRAMNHSWYLIPKQLIIAMHGLQLALLTRRSSKRNRGLIKFYPLIRAVTGNSCEAPLQSVRRGARYLIVRESKSTRTTDFSIILFYGSSHWTLVSSYSTIYQPALYVHSLS